MRQGGSSARGAALSIPACPVPILAVLLLLGACAAPQGLRGIPRASPEPAGAVRLDPGRADRVLSSGARLPSRGLPVAESTASGEELARVTAILRDLQALSFANNTEYCGYLGLDRSGAWATTDINEGSEASCPLPRVPAGLTLVASFHTHGTYSPYYASEWPTAQDMNTDASDDIDGYISTPGGRLWHVDTDTMTVRELCGRGCLPQDPSYVAADDGPLRPVMSYAELVAWENG